MAFACALTMAFNIQSGLWHRFQLFRVALRCITFFYPMDFCAVFPVFVFLQQACLSFSGLPSGEHGCMGLFSLLAIACALTMIFNIYGYGLQCFRVVLSSMAMDFCATCHVWLFLQASVSVLFMFSVSWAWEDAMGGALLSDCRAVWWGKIASQYRSPSTSFYF